MKVDFSAFTHRGTNLQNQDRIYTNPEYGVFAIADGCGGCGEDAATAAQIAIDLLAYVYEPQRRQGHAHIRELLPPALLEFVFPTSPLEEVAECARTALKNFCNMSGKDTDCAFLAAQVKDDPLGYSISYTSAGDIRLYVMRDSPILMNSPHGLPGSQKLLNSLRSDGDFEKVNLYSTKKNRFMMFSDGFLGIEGYENLIRLAAEAPDTKSARELIEAKVQSATGPEPYMPLDNISVILFDASLEQ